MNDSTTALPRMRVEGRPAAFAGGEPERRWRDALETALRPIAPHPAARGLRVSFGLPFPTAGRAGADLDNLLDPVLSVLVNRLGWFGGRRPGIDFLWATKSYAERTGCEVEMLETPPSDAMAGTVLLDAVYVGSPPISARDEDLARWVQEHASQPRPGAVAAFGVALALGAPRVNLGDIATGRLKPLIDCLWPVIGGTPGAPDDHLVTELRLSRDLPVAEGVRITVWRTPIEPWPARLKGGRP